MPEAAFAGQHRGRSDKKSDRTKENVDPESHIENEETVHDAPGDRPNLFIGSSPTYIKDDSPAFRLRNARAGRPNEHLLADVPGEWQPATVTGTLFQEGWGAASGYPGIVLDEHGDEVAGFLFSSENLAEHWIRLDKFEGEGYERVLTTVKLTNGSTVEAYIYKLSGNASPPNSPAGN